jgi:hypothetical protein
MARPEFISIIDCDVCRAIPPADKVEMPVARSGAMFKAAAHLPPC